MLQCQCVSNVGSWRWRKPYCTKELYFRFPYIMYGIMGIFVEYISLYSNIQSTHLGHLHKYKKESYSNVLFHLFNFFFQIFKEKKKTFLFCIQVQLKREVIEHGVCSLCCFIQHHSSGLIIKILKNKTLKIMTSGDWGMTHVATLPRRYHNRTQLQAITTTEHNSPQRQMDRTPTKCL